MDFNCDLCNISVNSEAIMETHVRGKKHLKNVERSIQTSERCIYVRNFPKSVNADQILEKYFEKFGTIEEIIVEATNQNFALVKFKSLGSACAALQQKKHHIGNFNLTLMPKKTTVSNQDRMCVIKNPSNNQDSQPSFVDSAVIRKLLDANSIEQQFQLLISELEIPADDCELRQIVTDMLQGLFFQYFPGCTVHQYGSTATGLGFQGCDMDIFLDLKLDKAVRIEEAAQVPIDFPNMKHIAAFRYIKRGYMTREELANISFIDQARLINKILVTSAKGVTDVFTIPSTRCPIVKFTHQPTSHKIDLSFKSRLAIRNTGLLKLYRVLEPRFRPLVFAIRFWAKQQELNGDMNAGSKLTNYALTLLIIFYLQSVEPMVLPTVKYLNELADEHERFTIDSWDCSYTTDKSKIAATTNTMSVTELLIGFFKFYSEFDFHNNLICPRTGQLLPVCKIHLELPVRAAQNYRAGPMNIQDPFSLEHNTAQNVNDRMRNLFYHRCKNAYNDCVSEKFNYRSSEERKKDDLWGLTLTYVEGSPFTDATKPHQAKGIEQAFNIAMMPDKCPKFFMKIAMMEGVELNEGWLSYTARAIRLIIEKVFFLKCRTLRCQTSIDIDVELNVDLKTPLSSSNSLKSNQSSFNLKKDAKDVIADDKKLATTPEVCGPSATNESSKQTLDSIAGTGTDNTTSHSPVNKGENCAAKRPLTDTSCYEPDSKKPKSISELMEPEFESKYEYCPAGDVQVAMQCRLFHKIWLDRKNILKRINRKEFDPLSLEAKITKLVRETGEHEMDQCMQFTVEITEVFDPCSVQVVFRLQTQKLKGDFNTFQAFMKQMIPKLLAYM